MVEMKTMIIDDPGYHPAPDLRLALAHRLLTPGRVLVVISRLYDTKATP